MKVARMLTVLRMSRSTLFCVLALLVSLSSVASGAAAAPKAPASRTVVNKNNNNNNNNKPLTREQYIKLKSLHPVFSGLNRDGSRVTIGATVFNFSRLLWNVLIVLTCFKPNEAVYDVLRALPLVGAKFPLTSIANLKSHDRLVAAGVCMLITSLRQLLQNNYISPNGNNFDVAAALKIGLGVPSFLFGLTFSSLCIKSQVTSSFGSKITDQVGIALFVVGALTETLSELQRKAWKSRSVNKGKVFTEGLFSLARHINYLGEVFWYTGMALLTTGNPLVAIGIFVMLAGNFLAVAIPELAGHMEIKYKAQWTDYKNKTPKALIPFVV